MTTYIFITYFHLSMHCGVYLKMLLLQFQEYVFCFINLCQQDGKQCMMEKLTKPQQRSKTKSKTVIFWQCQEIYSAIEFCALLPHFIPVQIITSDEHFLYGLLVVNYHCKCIFLLPNTSCCTFNNNIWLAWNI